MLVIYNYLVDHGEGLPMLSTKIHFFFVRNGEKVESGPARIESHGKPFRRKRNNLLSKSQFTKVLEGSNMT